MSIRFKIIFIIIYVNNKVYLDIFISIYIEISILNMLKYIKTCLYQIYIFYRSLHLQQNILNIINILKISIFIPCICLMINQYN